MDEILNAEALRVWARELRSLSEAAATLHVETSRNLSGAALTAGERLALEAAAKVYDCQMRRNRIWADLLESAAAEIEEL